MFERVHQICRDGGWVCFGFGAGADVATNHVVSTLTICGLIAGIAFHSTGVICAVLKRREESRQAKAKAWSPWAGLTYDQREGHGRN